MYVFVRVAAAGRNCSARWWLRAGCRSCNWVTMQAAEKCIKSRRWGSPGWNWPWMIVARASALAHTRWNMARQIATASIRSGYKLVGAGILDAKQDELQRPHFSLDLASKRPDLMDLPHRITNTHTVEHYTGLNVLWNCNCSHLKLV